MIRSVSNAALLLLLRLNYHSTNALHSLYPSDVFKSKYSWVLYSPSELIENVDESIHAVVFFLSVFVHRLPIFNTPGCVRVLHRVLVALGTVRLEI